ncbi:MAG: hypothetical protein ACLT2T_09375 [Bilophila wadsworthia]
MQSPGFWSAPQAELVPGYLDSKDCRTFVEESVRNAEVIKG